MHWKRQVARIIPPRQAQLLVVIVDLHERCMILIPPAHYFDVAMYSTNSTVASCVLECLARRIPPRHPRGDQKNKGAVRFSSGVLPRCFCDSALSCLARRIPPSHPRGDQKKREAPAPRACGTIAVLPTSTPSGQVPSLQCSHRRAPGDRACPTPPLPPFKLLKPQTGCGCLQPQKTMLL